MLSTPVFSYWFPSGQLQVLPILFFYFLSFIFFDNACQIYWTGSLGGFVCPHACCVGTEQMRAAWSSCAGDNLYQQQDSPLVPVHPPPPLCSSLLPVRFVCE